MDSGAKPMHLSDRHQRVLPDTSFSNNTTFLRMGQNETQCFSGFSTQSFVLLLFINDLPNTIADLTKLVLFADDKSIIIPNPGPSKFKEDINSIIDDINDWFKVN